VEGYTKPSAELEINVELKYQILKDKGIEKAKRNC
jgi:hypothetical protein